MWIPTACRNRRRVAEPHGAPPDTDLYGPGPQAAGGGRREHHRRRRPARGGPGRDDVRGPGRRARRPAGGRAAAGDRPRRARRGDPGRQAPPEAHQSGDRRARGRDRLGGGLPLGARVHGARAAREARARARLDARGAGDRDRGGGPARGRPPARDRSPRRQALPRPPLAAQARPLPGPPPQARAPGPAGAGSRAADPHLSGWRIVFMGTPAFACPSLEALLARTDDAVVGVVCQPDRPRGRGLAVTAPEVKRLAASRGIPVLQPERLSDPGFAAALRDLAPDLIVVAAYGKILPRWILDLPPRGCINVHASLLPRHRGAAPIPWPMDAGDVLLVRAVAIEPEDTAGTLGARLAALGAAALVEALDGLKAGRLRPTPQPTEGITFAPRLTPEQGRLDWSRPAAELDRVVRAFAPVPGAFTTLGNRRLKVHRARPETRSHAAPPGTVVHAEADGIVVATGAGALRLLEVQLEGRRRLAAKEFLAGHPLAVGTCLGTP